MSETTVQQWLSEQSMIVEHNLPFLRNLIGLFRGTKPLTTYINSILLIKGIIIRANHNIYACMLINIVLMYICCV